MKSWIAALRSVVRRPAFAATVFALLGLGIAANTALFSVVDTVLLKPLPYPNPERLIRVEETSSAKSQKTSVIAPGRIEDWNRLSHTLTAVSGVYSESVTDTGGGDPERLFGVGSIDFVSVAGAAGLLGALSLAAAFVPARRAAAIDPMESMRE